jgi:hypothetical protein
MTARVAKNVMKNVNVLAPSGLSFAAEIHEFEFDDPAVTDAVPRHNERTGWNPAFTR